MNQPLELPVLHKPNQIYQFFNKPYLPVFRQTGFTSISRETISL
jgi:hypothetical protein